VVPDPATTARADAEDMIRRWADSEWPVACTVKPAGAGPHFAIVGAIFRRERGLAITAVNGCFAEVPTLSSADRIEIATSEEGLMTLSSFFPLCEITMRAAEPRWFADVKV